MLDARPVTGLLQSMAAQVNQMPAAPNASTQMPINAAGLSTRGAPKSLSPERSEQAVDGMAPRPTGLGKPAR